MRLPVGAVRGIGAALRVTGRTVAAVPAVVEAILVLPVVARQLEEVRGNTAALPDILAELQRVQADTVALPVMTHELARMANGVQRIEDHTAGVEQLAEIALPLQGAAMRVGRFADRLPQRRALRPGV